MKIRGIFEQLPSHSHLSRLWYYTKARLAVFFRLTTQTPFKRTPPPPPPPPPPFWKEKASRPYSQAFSTSPQTVMYPYLYKWDQHKLYIDHIFTAMGCIYRLYFQALEHFALSVLNAQSLKHPIRHGLTIFLTKCLSKLCSESIYLHLTPSMKRVEDITSALSLPSSWAISSNKDHLILKAFSELKTTKQGVFKYLLY